MFSYLYSFLGYLSLVSCFTSKDNVVYIEVIINKYKINNVGIF